MTTYVRFIDANTVQPVPQTYTWPDGTTTSNFHLSPPDVLARAGFLPLIEGARPTPDATTFVGPPTYTSDGTKVTSTYALAPLPPEVVNRATIEQALAQALPGLASIDTQLQTLSTITLSGTTAQQLAQVQAALRGIGTNLRPVVAGVRRAVRLLSDRLDGTT